MNCYVRVVILGGTISGDILFCVYAAIYVDFFYNQKICLFFKMGLASGWAAGNDVGEGLLEEP